MYIFLDLDGVLVREPPLNSNQGIFVLENGKYKPQFTPECLNFFENSLRSYSNYQIVISSSWKELFSLEEIKSHFSPDIAVNIVGVTPDDHDPSAYYRYREAKKYLEQNNLDDVFWLAIDDIPEHYPAQIPIIITNAEIGFDCECAKLLQKYLALNN
jgi:hypothetical protein